MRQIKTAIVSGNMKWRIAIHCMALGAWEIIIFKHGHFFEIGKYQLELPR
jgi:hypothetical protein